MQMLDINGTSVAARIVDKDNSICRKYGNTKIRTIRNFYGPAFAVGFEDEVELREVFAALDERSLTRLVADDEAGCLARKIIVASAW